MSPTSYQTALPRNCEADYTERRQMIQPLDMFKAAIGYRELQPFAA